jgi:predicted short-subunit dehydrogenase-like oxidoreductase (DUF2520 family)
VYNHQSHLDLFLFEEKFEAQIFNSLNSIIRNADYYFICVKDEEIELVSKKIVKSAKSMVMHCSGSVSINALEKHPRAAVFYPVQTFSKMDKISWPNIPLCIQGKTVSQSKQIELLAKNFSNKVYFVNQTERNKIHLAAVFANNFTNALLHEAAELLPEKFNRNLNLLLPLLEQTMLKLQNMSPAQAQTGPAKRGDDKVMQQHLKLISSSKKNKLKTLYELMSDLIQQQIISYQKSK